MDVDSRVKSLIEALDQLAEDTSVPRNIRRGANDAKDRLTRMKDALDIRLASAIFILEELANDPNIPMHGRTSVLQLLAGLENTRRDIETSPQVKK
ncbi:MAG TPA: UPF0147 family protein [Thermoplasmata archaeon]|nr:UPF0147 family protein [Thermoplasmata archaeon]